VGDLRGVSNGQLKKQKMVSSAFTSEIRKGA